MRTCNSPANAGPAAVAGQPARVAVGGRHAGLPHRDRAAGSQHATRLARGRPDVVGRAHGGEDREQQHQRAASRQARAACARPPPRRAPAAPARGLRAPAQLAGPHPSAAPAPPPLAPGAQATSPSRSPHPTPSPPAATHQRLPLRAPRTRSGRAIRATHARPPRASRRCPRCSHSTPAACADPRGSRRKPARSAPLTLASDARPVPHPLLPSRARRRPGAHRGVGAGWPSAASRSQCTPASHTIRRGKSRRPTATARYQSRARGPCGYCEASSTRRPTAASPGASPTTPRSLPAALAAAPAAGAVDVVVAESPPLFTAAAGVAYARLKRAALALNVSDLWPQSAIELGVLSAGGPPALRLAALARLCYRDARLITAPTKGIVETLRGRMGPGPPRRWCMFRRPSIWSASLATTRAAPRSGAPLRVLYAGTLGLAQGLDTLRAGCRARGPEVVELLIAGEGPEGERLRALVRTPDLPHVRLLGPVRPAKSRLSTAPSTPASCPCATCRLYRCAAHQAVRGARRGAPRDRGGARRGRRSSCATPARASRSRPRTPRRWRRRSASLHASPADALQMGARGRDYARHFDRARRRSCQLVGAAHRPGGHPLPTPAN